MILPGPVINLFLSKKAKRSLFSLIAIQLDAGLEIEEALEQSIETMRIRGLPMGAMAARYIRSQESNGDMKAAFMEFASGSEALILSDLGKKDAPLVFRGVVRVMSSVSTIRRAILSNLVQPLVLIIATVGLFALLHFALLPQVVDGQSAPSSLLSNTYAVTLFIEANIVFIGLGLLGWWAFLALYGYHSSDPVRRNLFDRLLISYRLNKITVGNAFWITVIEKMKVGGEITTETMRELARHQGPYASGCINRIVSKMANRKIGAAILAADKNWPDRELNAMFAAVTGSKDKLDEAIIGFERYFDDWLLQIEDRIKTIANIARNILMVLIACTLGLILFVIRDLALGSIL